jgi:2-dehydropantoate 2-reductase
MKLAILGAGSLGTILGAVLTKNGYDVTLIDSYKEHVDALNQYGATVIGTMELNVPVKAITPDEMQGYYDIVFLLVKQTHTKEALEMLLPHIRKDSIVCTLQNGLPEHDVVEIVGRERTVGGSVMWGATFIKPGVSMLTQSMDDIKNIAFEIGEIDGKITDRIEKIAEILSAMGPTHPNTNFMGLRWRKLLYNVTMSGMSAALGSTFGEVLDNDKATTCLAFIAKETLEVCEAQGIDMQNELGRFKTPEELQKSKAGFVIGWNGARLLKASMLQDLEKGRKTEIDKINGAVCEWGRKLGIKTPVNDTVVKIVKAAEQGEITVQISNLDYFTDDMLSL